jgi:hypothetical protein
MLGSVMPMLWGMSSQRRYFSGWLKTQVGQPKSAWSAAAPKVIHRPSCPLHPLKAIEKMLEDNKTKQTSEASLHFHRSNPI